MIILISLLGNFLSIIFLFLCTIACLSVTQFFCAMQIAMMDVHVEFFNERVSWFSLSVCLTVYLFLQLWLAVCFGLSVCEILAIYGTPCLC